MLAILVLNSVNYNGDDDNGDDRSTLEDLSRAKNGQQQRTYDGKNYNYKSADNKIVLIIPLKIRTIIVIVIIPGCDEKINSLYRMNGFVWSPYPIIISVRLTDFRCKPFGRNHYFCYI